MTLLALLALGFLLGMRHATDADHVVAVTTLVSRERSPRAALALGALWGLGHTLTILLVGGAIVLLGLTIPPRLGLSLEMGVALTLILLGTLNLTRAAARSTDPSPTHPHRTGTPGSWAYHFATALRRGSRSLLVGVVHGLAGSAGVALLVLTTIGRARSALVYLAVFGVGTVVGMMLITLAMALPLRLASERFVSAERVMARTLGALSLAFGLFLAYRIGFVDGLLLADAKWTPQ